MVYLQKLSKDYSAVKKHLRCTRNRCYIPILGPVMRDVTPERTTESGLPKWCTEDLQVPELYKHVLEASVV